MKTFVIVAAFLAGMLLIAEPFVFSRPTAAASAAAKAVLPMPLGQDQASPDALLVNGWTIPRDPPFAQAYQNWRTFLGVPISDFDGVSQMFSGGRLISIPTNGPDQQVIVDDLGRQNLILRGITETPNVPPDPMLARLLLEARDTGYAPADLYGRVLTPAICDEATPKHCQEFTDKQIAVWTVGDAAATRLPIGCIMWQPCSRLLSPSPPKDSSANRLIPLGAGVFLILVALALFATSHLADTSGNTPYAG